MTSSFFNWLGKNQRPHNTFFHAETYRRVQVPQRKESLTGPHPRALAGLPSAAAAAATRAGGRGQVGGGAASEAEGPQNLK